MKVVFKPKVMVTAKMLKNLVSTDEDLRGVVGLIEPIILSN